MQDYLLTFKILDIINRPVVLSFILKYDDSETGSSFRLQVEPTHMR
jgi:hypothetical protein